jgi:hypothetical protein
VHLLALRPRDRLELRRVGRELGDRRVDVGEQLRPQVAVVGQRADVLDALAVARAGRLDRASTACPARWPSTAPRRSSSDRRLRRRTASCG